MATLGELGGLDPSLPLEGKRVLLIISGGIAAYKALDLIRRLKERGCFVRAILTKGGQEFISPLSVASLSEQPVFTDLWSLKDETEMGHIRLSRETDLILIAPASAHILARMAHGMSDDLATTTLLASDKPVMVAPAMNVMMWQHPATRANMATLRDRGVLQVGPGAGDMACGETGSGRMAEPLEIVAAVKAHFDETDKIAGRLAGLRAIVTSGPTAEPIDPVRVMTNRSSGKQGHAIAAALAKAGAETVLVSGPTSEPVPPGVIHMPVETAREMLAACENALPADIAVCAAAVADWRVEHPPASKMKKNGGGPPTLTLVENPDILKTIAHAGNRRPRLVVGFAAETDDVVANAIAKRVRKGCDWIVANAVGGETGTFGGAHNKVHLIQSAKGASVDEVVEDWPDMSKTDVAAALVDRMAHHFGRS